MGTYYQVDFQQEVKFFLLTMNYVIYFQIDEKKPHLELLRGDIKKFPYVFKVLKPIFIRKSFHFPTLNLFK